MIIATINNQEQFEYALKSKVNILFDLATDIFTITEKVNETKKYQKEYYVNIDMITGIGKDDVGIKYLQSIGVDGIISSKLALVNSANKIGLKTVQRFFIIDTQSFESTLSKMDFLKASMIEIMPGTSYNLIKRISEQSQIPIVAGGLLETEDTVTEALENGAYAVATENMELWG